MTGLELLRTPSTTAEQIADIIAEHCPPITPEHCDKLSCRKCWLSWLATGEAPKEEGPSDKQTTPDEEGLHPNLAEQVRKQYIQAYKEQTEVNMIVRDIYQAIILCEGSDIPSEQRLQLLESLWETYCQRHMSRKLGAAHQVAINGVLGLFSVEGGE